ncbi:MAG: chalcone isomerase family protein [Desulfobacterales bacterium]
MKATKSWTILTFVLLCVTLTNVPRVETAEIEGVNFDDRYTIADTTLKLRGTGLLRVMIFAKIYVAALYLSEDYPSKAPLSDVPKRLEVEYLRSIAGKDFGPATNKKVSENVDPQTFQRLQPRLQYHNSLYEDVQPGDRYALTYIPGKGTELTLNGEPKGTIEGADFAAALFSIWLGPKPISESLKKELLDLS